MTNFSLTNEWNNVLLKVKKWARINSPWLIHYNSGSCNGCDIEILATLTPRYDAERFGVKLQGSPRHADVLICTGPVTRQSRDGGRLLRNFRRRFPGLLQRSWSHRRSDSGGCVCAGLPAATGSDY